MEKSDKWSSAAMDGLLLSLVTIIYTLVLSILEPAGFMVKTILWLAKFGGSLYLLWYFMKKNSAGFDVISYGQSFNYGFIVSLFSSIICGCFSYVQIEWLFPEQTQKVMEMTQEMFAQQAMTAEAETMMESMMNNMGRVSLFTNLIYCTIYGAVASSIIANFTKKTNPFEGEYEE